jgi:hypothetical protein
LLSDLKSLDKKNFKTFLSKIEPSLGLLVPEKLD